MLQWPTIIIMIFGQGLQDTAVRRVKQIKSTLKRTDIGPFAIMRAVGMVCTRFMEDTTK